MHNKGDQGRSQGQRGRAKSFLGSIKWSSSECDLTEVADRLSSVRAIIIIAETLLRWALCRDEFVMDSTILKAPTPPVYESGPRQSNRRADGFRERCSGGSVPDGRIFR